MTDKQIIIDKSKCKHYWNGNCSDWDNKLIGACDDFEDCYCKMYLRKEQECEFSNLRIIQLQETLSQYETDLSTKDCIVETCKAQYKELKAENDELKRELIQYEKDVKDLNYFAIKLKQTLTEIKEIVKEQLPTVNYNFAKSMHPEMFNCYEQILQKISEVENEN